MKDFYLTTPIYYVNAKPHLGHAYSTLVADAMVRYRQLMGEQAFFLTGTDEHGDKIVRAAAQQGQSPEEFADAVSLEFRNLWPRLDISNYRFARTTDAAHQSLVRQILQKVHDAGDIYFAEFSGHYCYGCERFYTEKELEDGLCPQHRVRPELVSEKNYFFRMSRYLPWLREHIANNADFIRPERYRNEALAMLESGALEDLCISRPKARLAWGIELPFDSDYVCYVWFDALITYISALGGEGADDFARAWPGEHLVAKDILKPHAVFWPTMLKAAGLPIFSHLNVHGYWLSRETKMSKSLGNVVDPLAMVERFGIDAFRYFLLREMHFGSDANFSEDALIDRINADLANDLGNLFSRVLAMTGKYFNSRVPDSGRRGEDDEEIIELCASSMRNFLRLFGRLHFSQALESLWELVRALNRYVDSQAPWALHKQGDTARLGTVMYVLLACMRKVALCLWPVMPGAACSLLRQLGQQAERDTPPVSNINDETSCFGGLFAGTDVAARSNLFPRIDRKGGSRAEAPQDRAEADTASRRDAPAEGVPDEGGNVDIETFKTLDIRMGAVLTAEKHPNADRILRLMIDFGEGRPRQILSGLAEHYAPADLVGKQVCAVLNLKPRKIRGLVSHGMVLTVQGADTLCLLSASRNMPNGSRIG